MRVNTIYIRVIYDLAREEPSLYHRLTLSPPHYHKSQVICLLVSHYSQRPTPKLLTRWRATFALYVTKT